MRLIDKIDKDKKSDAFPLMEHIDIPSNYIKYCKFYACYPCELDDESAEITLLYNDGRDAVETSFYFDIYNDLDGQLFKEYCKGAISEIDRCLKKAT